MPAHMSNKRKVKKRMLGLRPKTGRTPQNPAKTKTGPEAISEPVEKGKREQNNDNFVGGIYKIIILLSWEHAVTVPRADNDSK